MGTRTNPDAGGGRVPVDAVAHRVHPGQAMIELAAGMLALALVLAATLGFTNIILSSLRQQATLRREAGVNALNGFGDALNPKTDTDTAEVNSLIFGQDTFKVKETVAIPNMGGLNL